MNYKGDEYALSMDQSLMRNGRLVPTAEAVELLTEMNTHRGRQWLDIVRANARLAPWQQRHLGPAGVVEKWSKKDGPATKKGTGRDRR